jgi:hypothetical protein
MFHCIRFSYTTCSHFPRVAPPNDSPDSVAFQPYVGSIFNCISKMLHRHIMSAGFPSRAISSFLRSAGDDLELGHQEITAIPVSAILSKLDTRIDTSLKVHHRLIRQSQPWRSTASSSITPAFAPINSHMWTT